MNNYYIEEHARRAAETHKWLTEMHAQLQAMLDRSGPIKLTNHPEEKTQEQIEEGFKS